MSGPLHGIKIVEMVGIGPAPFAAMMLADQGAEVTRIHQKGGRPEIPLQNSPYDVLARNRPSIAIDLKADGGTELALALIGKADGVIEGFRPGVMERLGLGPDLCLAHNPRLVYGRMTRWGQTGPFAHTVGHDLNYLALTGALHAMGAAGAPPPVPLNLVADFGGGGMLRGLKARIERECRVPVHMSPMPLEAVVLGAGHCIEHYDALKNMFMGARR